MLRCVCVCDERISGTERSSDLFSLEAPGDVVVNAEGPRPRNPNDHRRIAGGLRGPSGLGFRFGREGGGGELCHPGKDGGSEAASGIGALKVIAELSVLEGLEVVEDDGGRAAAIAQGLGGR